MPACKQCQQPFTIDQQDLAFYDKVSPVVNGQKYSLPTPTLCPRCRTQRRISFRNFWNLYNRTCQLSGKPIISMYKPDTAYTVYDAQEWWSDKWDALNYGKDIDWQKSFFEQFGELLKTVPKFAVHNILSENCAYSNMVFGSKNCYLVFGCIENEDCLYSHILAKSKHSMGGAYSFQLENCYDCRDCTNCYNLRFSDDCDNCFDASFLINCRSCKNCFGCVGLKQKEYCLFNEQLSKDEYQQRVKKYSLLNDNQKAEIFNQLEKLKHERPFLYMHSLQVENCTGDYIYTSKNVLDSFDVRNSEDCRYCATTRDGKDSYDINYTLVKHELCYENVFVNGYHVMFSHLCQNNCRDLYYCDCCFSCQDCFGCVGLRNKQYCIFNKQYSKDEYELLVGRLIQYMVQTKEWGEFWPISLSPFAYNESMAQIYFPLDKDQVVNKGFSWKEDLVQNKFAGQEIAIPEDINQVADSLLKEILTCQQCHKNYRVVGQELAFYRDLQLPVPKICFFCRNKNRLNARNPRKLYERNCTKCHTPLQTTYAPERPEQILCESCYLKEL